MVACLAFKVAVLVAAKTRIWNLTRFHPFWALIEMTMGVAAVRDVMLDTEEDKKKPPTILARIVYTWDAAGDVLNFDLCKCI